MNALLAAVAILLVLLVIAAVDREGFVETQDHVWCLTMFGGGEPGSKEYLECRRARAARRGNRSNPGF